MITKKPRNPFEKAIERQLKRRKLSFKYEPEKIPYHWVGHYTPDFVITTASGKIYIEAKGYLRPEDKRKLVAVKRLNPKIDLRIVFYPFTSHKREKSYTKWAERNGIRYAIGSIPKEWLQ